MMVDLDFILPAFLGFSAGILPPLIIEKLKNKKEEKQKLASIENDIQHLQNSLQSHSSNLSTLEEKVRALEINLSHNTGALKAKIPDMPLEDTTANLQTSFSTASSQS
jgi:hypothetical protein